jgi:hypothetical protein
MTPAFPLLALLAALQAPVAAAPTPAPEPAREKPPVPPGPLHLQLVPVGGALDDRVRLYFDTTSIKTAPDGKKMVWKLYIFDNPRMIGRVMAQAIWTLSDYDCEDSTVADRNSSLLGMGLELQRSVPANTGSRLYRGVMANAIIAEEVCNNTPAPGYRSSSVMEAVRRARADKD